jgi:hypothetical protein
MGVEGERMADGINKRWEKERARERKGGERSGGCANEQNEQ